MNFKATLLFFAGVLLLSSCERVVIPESRFINIYHDILLADAYVGSSVSLVRSTDSLVVYQGIIESHGCTVPQFVNAQNFYVAHPETFAKMLKKLQQRLIAEGRELAEQAKAEFESDTLKRDSLRTGHKVFRMEDDEL